MAKWYTMVGVFQNGRLYVVSDVDMKTRTARWGNGNGLTFSDKYAKIIVEGLVANNINAFVIKSLFEMENKYLEEEQ